MDLTLKRVATNKDSRRIAVRELALPSPTLFEQLSGSLHELLTSYRVPCGLRWKRTAASHKPL